MQSLVIIVMMDAEAVSLHFVTLGCLCLKQGVVNPADSHNI